MNANPEILFLLGDILQGKSGRAELARWLARRSRQFIESANEVDRMIIADLDAAMGEIQRGLSGEELLVQTTEQLIRGLDLEVPGQLGNRVTVNMYNLPYDVTTGTSSQGSILAATATVIYPVEVQVVSRLTS